MYCFQYAIGIDTVLLDIEGINGFLPNQDIVNSYIREVRSASAGRNRDTARGSKNPSPVFPPLSFSVKIFNESGRCCYLIF